jgi:hypothetical protein
MDIADICSRLEALTEAVRGIALGMEQTSHRGAAFAAPMAELPPAPSPNQRPRYLPTDWPKIGGRIDLPEFGNLFVSSAYRDQYREGEGREIYAGACDGLARLASRLRMPLFKVSSCGLGRLAERMKELGRDRYASEWFCNGAYVVEQEGFEGWFPSHMYVTKPPAPNSPVTIGPRALSVRLPRTMSAEAFDLAFDAEVRKAAIHTLGDERRWACGTARSSKSTPRCASVRPPTPMVPPQEVARPRRSSSSGFATTPIASSTSSNG